MNLKACMITLLRLIWYSVRPSVWDNRISNAFDVRFVSCRDCGTKFLCSDGSALGYCKDGYDGCGDTKCCCCPKCCLEG